MYIRVLTAKTQQIPYVMIATNENCNEARRCRLEAFESLEIQNSDEEEVTGLLGLHLLGLRLQRSQLRG